MTAIASLLDPGSLAALAKARRQAEQRQAEAQAAPPRPAACEACGRPFPPPPVAFRSPAEHQAPPEGPARNVDPSRAPARA